MIPIAAAKRHGAALMALGCALALAPAAEGHPITGAVSEYAARTVGANEFRNIPGIGTARPTSTGLWEVRLADGFTMLTHGLDPAPTSTDPSTTHDMTTPSPSIDVATPHAPSCTPAFNGNQFQVLYAYPAGKQNQLATWRPKIRSAVDAANGIVRHDSLDYSNGAREVNLRVRCNTNGDTDVQAFQSKSSPNGQATFESVVQDARNAGFQATARRYPIFMQGGQRSHGRLRARRDRRR